MVIKLLDSHVHLWPGTDANHESHSWMKAGDHLARQYSIQEYLTATDKHDFGASVAGIVYVETDRTVIGDADADVTSWAAEPLKEIAFLRRIVEGNPLPDDGFTKETTHVLKGIVAWAPLDRPLPDFLQYMSTAKEIAGEKTWHAIKGFRFLLQGIKDEARFRQILDPNSSSFIALLKFLGPRGLTFDVGVDQRQGGVWQLEHIAEALERAHEGIKARDRTTFILNHLCKPDMEQAPSATEKSRHDFAGWKSAISRMSKQENIYMKLSGAFSEIADQDPGDPLSVADVLDRMRPWLDHVFDAFGPWRIMFGSDWPVCNVRGPGDVKSWSLWVQVVDQILLERNLSEVERNRVWYGTAIEAYKLDPLV